MIVVTTPTGNIGRHVVRHLLDAGEMLRLIVRDPSKLPPEVRKRVEVVEGSHGDAAVVDRAFQGADAVFWLCPPVRTTTPDAQTVEFTRPAAGAIRLHGVLRIVAATTLGGAVRPGRTGAAWRPHRSAWSTCCAGRARQSAAWPCLGSWTMRFTRLRPSGT